MRETLVRVQQQLGNTREMWLMRHQKEEAQLQKDQAALERKEAENLAREKARREKEWQETHLSRQQQIQARARMKEREHMEEQIILQNGTLFFFLRLLVGWDWCGGLSCLRFGVKMWSQEEQEGELAFLAHEQVR